MVRQPRPTQLCLEVLEDRLAMSIDTSTGNIVIKVPANATMNNVTVGDTFKWVKGKKEWGYKVQNLYEINGKAGKEKDDFIPVGKVKGDRIIFHGGKYQDHFQYTMSPYTEAKLLKVEAYGYGGSDTLKGWDADDKLVGGDESWQPLNAKDRDIDQLFGGNGKDHLYGGPHGDWLYGQDGEDWLYGGSGGDVLEGGADRDKDRLFGNYPVVSDGATDTFRIESVEFIVIDIAEDVADEDKEAYI